jgi:catechol 2,3-dioxygenase
MTTLPLDTGSLLGELADPAHEPFEGLPAGTVMGHVHLCVADIPNTIAFYRDVLGFGLMASLGTHAAFLSAGGYHHHIGANTWESAGAGQAPAGAASLEQATILLPSEVDRDRLVARVADTGREPVVLGDGMLVRDPSGNPIVLAAVEQR